MTTLLTENKFSDAYETKIAQSIHYRSAKGNKDYWNKN